MRQPSVIVGVSVGDSFIMHSEAFFSKTMVQLLLFIPCWLMGIDPCMLGWGEVLVSGSVATLPISDFSAGHATTYDAPFKGSWVRTRLRSN